MEPTTEKSEEEVAAAYKVAKRLANSLMSRMRSGHEHYLEFDDFVQEGMLAWLRGHSMYGAMVRAFGKSSKMSRYSYKVKEMREPITVSVDEIGHIPDMPDETFEKIEKKIDTSKLLKRILEIEDEQAQFAVLAYYSFGLTLREIGHVLGRSHEFVRTYLIDPQIRKLREELA